MMANNEGTEKLGATGDGLESHSGVSSNTPSGLPTHNMLRKEACSYKPQVYN